MPYERRARGAGKRYYTRTVRVAGRRVRLYFGCGPLGEIAYLTDLLARVERELARRRRSGDAEAG